jgi:hypothetical protein
MKNTFLLFITFFLYHADIYAQDSIQSRITRISNLDKKIYMVKNVDVITLSENIINTLRISAETRDDNKDILVERLYRLLELENPAIETDTLLYFLENVRYYETVYELYSKLNHTVMIMEENMSNPEIHPKETYLGGLKRNLKMVEDHMKYILGFYYCQYTNVNTSRKGIKGVYMEIDNDLLAFTNLDMNYTGGGRFEITTDYFKMQLLPFLSKEKILSYQGIFIGFKAYTPYIRDTSIFKTNTSFDIDDRPFASFSFIGRSKYRIHSSGYIRHRSDFKMGFIGGNVGNIVQSIIHRDQFVLSLKPNGWESQIANGGRFAWNIDHYLEIMLFSGNGDIFSLNKRKYTWLNIPVLFEAHIGNEITSLGAGIAISNLGFLDRSGNEDIKLPGLKKVRLHISANAKYNYIVHNSMLEGIGIFNTFPDDDDPLAPKDVYRLEADEVARHLFLSELFIGLRTMKVTVYWKLTINSKEYLKPKAKEMYQWARFGVNFML